MVVLYHILLQTYFLYLVCHQKVLSAPQVLGYAAGVLHGIDALMALKLMRSVRATL